VLGEVELDDVPAPRRHDRVDAYPGHVRAEDAPVAHGRPRISGADDVLPTADTEDEAEQVEQDRQGEGAPGDSGDRPEERLGGVEEPAYVVHALTIAPPPTG
jgi:hypothetical protein